MVLFKLIAQGPIEQFLFAFRLPNMLRDMLGEGAANAAFVPVFAESREKQTDREYRDLVRNCLGLMLLVFSVLTVLGVLVMPLAPNLLGLLGEYAGGEDRSEAHMAVTVSMMQWTFPYLLFIGLTVFATAPLFVAGRYGVASWSPTLLNVALIAACLLLYKQFENPGWALVVGVWAGGVLQLLVMFAAMRRHVGVLLPRFNLRHPGIGKVLWLLLPVIFGQAAGEVNKLVDNFFAYAVSEGAVRALYTGNRMVQLPLSVFGIAISVAILPTLARAVTRGDHDEVRATLMHGFRQSLFLVLPAMAGIILLREPIVRLLFERGEFSPLATKDAAAAMLFYALGLPAFAWVKISVQGFYGVQDTRTPVIIASASMLLNIVLNFALVGPMGFRGLALATSIAFMVNFLLLFGLLCRRWGRLWDMALLGQGLKICLATAGMCAAAAASLAVVEKWLAGTGEWEQLAAVIVPITAAVAVYLVLAYLFRLSDLDAYGRAFRRRI